jgi:hypothetical protein
MRVNSVDLLDAFKIINKKRVMVFLDEVSLLAVFAGASFREPKAYLG